MTLLSDWKEQDEAIEIAKDQHEEPEWKAVGSPSRRGSLSVRVNPDKESTHAPLAPEKQWGSFGGFQWEGPSIFEEDGGTDNISQRNPVLSVPMLPSVPLEPTYRQKRSFSFSMGQSSAFFPYEDYDDRNYKSALAPTMEEEEEHQEVLFDDAAYLRARSQSTNAVFGMTPSSYWPNRSDRRSSLGFISFLPDSSPSFVSQRRMSQPVNDYSFSDFPNGGPANPLLGRTPSVSLPERLENLNVSKSTPKRLTPDDTTSAQQETAGKGILLQKLPPHVPLYCVEFKAGRTDYYYVSDPLLQLHLEDLVIVEADRGKDLGKITSGILTIDQVALQLQLQQQQQHEEEDETDCAKKSEFYVKRIYRPAGSSDVNLLQTKEQDERRALTVCLQKIKARKLSMEVVDAEYQWDRRKLTFYFNAEKRIDFRELVRELFKIYKTRIWMCAVNTSNRKQV